MPSYPVTVDGVSVLALWAQSASARLQTTNIITAGLAVDFPITFAADRPIALDPPIFTEFSFVMTAWDNQPAAFEYDAWLVTISDPPVFSASFHPTLIISNGDCVALATDKPHAAMAQGEELEIQVDMDLLTPIYRRATWNGRICVLFRSYYPTLPATTGKWNSFLNAVPDRYETEEVGFMTGMVGADPRAKSRMGRCDQCGEFMLRERLMHDGYSPGLWVCEDCWDPEEPPEPPIPPDMPPIND